MVKVDLLCIRFRTREHKLGVAGFNAVEQAPDRQQGILVHECQLPAEALQIHSVDHAVQLGDIFLVIENIGGVAGNVNTRGELQYAKELVKSGSVLCAQKIRTLLDELYNVNLKKDDVL